MAWSCLFQLQPSSRACEFVHWGLGEEGEAAKRGPERGRERLERSYVLHFLAAAWERSAPPPLRPVACAASFPCCAIQPHSFLFSLSQASFGSSSPGLFHFLTSSGGSLWEMGTQRSVAKRILHTQKFHPESCSSFGS